MADTTSLLSTTTRTTTLGNTISTRMLSFLGSVSSPPTGFRSLGLDFLSITQILNSLSSSLSSHFTTSTLPPQAVSELTKILTQTLKDFENLQILLEKFMDYEKGGAVGRVMKTWKSVFTDKDIAKVRDSLKASKGALTMAMYMTNINPNGTPASTTHEYGMLAAKLQQGSPDLQLSEGALSELLAEPKIPPELPDTSIQPPLYHQQRPSAVDEMSPDKEVATPSIPELSIPDRVPNPSLTPSMSPASTYEAQPQPEPKTLLARAPAGHEPSATTPTDQNTRPVVRIGLLGAMQEPGANASPARPEPKSLVPEASKTAPEPQSQKPEKQPIATPSLNANRTRIRIDRASLTFKTPSQTSEAGNLPLQNGLVSAINGQNITIIRQLLDRGVPFPVKPTNGLVVAIKHSSSETSLPILKLLLEYGADPNLSSPDTGTTPLWYAMRKENASMFHLLLEFGADPNVQMENGSTAFIYACERDSIPFQYVSEMLLYSADPNVCSRGSDSGLYAACVKNKPELVKLLLENGADPDLKGPELPIQGALKYPACLELLLKAGADLKKKKGIVEAAVSQNQIESVRVLLDAGADINEKHLDLFSPLTTAIREKRVEILALLIERGVDLHLKGQDYPLFMATKTPSILRQLLDAGADPAKAVGVMEMAVNYNQIKSVRILLDAGVSPNDKKDKLFNPLTTAVRENRPEIVVLLLSRGVNPNIKGQDMPLFMATKNPSLLKQLLACPSTDLNHTNNRGVLEMAVCHNKIESVEILLDAGVNSNDKKDKLFTPLTTAIRENRPEIIALLLSHGVNPNIKGQDMPLFMATKNPSLLKQLLAYPSTDLNHTNNRGVLEMAVCHNKIESVEILLDAGVNPNDKKDKLFTPLTTAIREKRSDILALLLKRGADPNLKGQDIPLVMAVKDTEILKQLIEGGADVKGCKGIVEAAVAKKNIPAIDVLLDAGAGINEKRMDVCTALATAVRENSIPIISHLLKRGADPNVASVTGLPVVMAASVPDQTRLKVLLEAGADVNGQFQGKSALMEASEKGLRDNVGLLIERGADANLVNLAGKSAMDIAAGKGYDDIVMMLLEAMR